MKQARLISSYFVVIFLITTMIFGCKDKDQKNITPTGADTTHTPLKFFSFQSPTSEIRTFPVAQKMVQEYSNAPLPIRLGAGGEFIRYVSIPDSFLQKILQDPKYAGGKGRGLRLYFVKELASDAYNILIAGIDKDSNNITSMLVNKNDPCPDKCIPPSDVATDLNYSKVEHDGTDKDAWCFPGDSGIVWKDTNGTVLTGARPKE